MKNDFAGLSAGPISGLQGTFAATIGPTGLISKYGVFNELT